MFRKTPEVSSTLYFVEISEVLEKLWLFNHKRADFWFPNFGFCFHFTASLTGFCQSFKGSEDYQVGQCPENQEKSRKM